MYKRQEELLCKTGITDYDIERVTDDPILHPGRAARITAVSYTHLATLLKIHPEITTVVQNVNTQKTSMVIGNIFDGIERPLPDVYKRQRQGSASKRQESAVKISPRSCLAEKRK